MGPSSAAIFLGGLLMLMLAAAAAAAADPAPSSSSSSSVPLPFPLPERIERPSSNTSSGPLAVYPHLFRMVDASRKPTRTVALALERYRVRTGFHV